MQKLKTSREYEIKSSVLKKMKFEEKKLCVLPCLFTAIIDGVIKVDRRAWEGHHMTHGSGVRLQSI